MSHCRDRLGTKGRILLRRYRGHYQNQYKSATTNSIVSDGIHKILTTHEVSSVLDPDNLDRFESNQLPANNPIEDRRFVGKYQLEKDGPFCYVFGVIDGHGGHRCAQAVNERLPNYLAMSSVPKDAIHNALASNPIKPLMDRLKLPNEYFTIKYQSLYNQAIKRYASSRLEGRAPESSKSFGERMTEAFERLDEDILTESGAVSDNTSLDSHTKGLERANSGACACVCTILEQQLTVANIGDCAAVIGSQTDSGRMVAKKLSHSHTVDNKQEVQRVLSNHPAKEHKTILSGGRLFGQLMPLRAFGDLRFKIKAEQMKKLRHILDFGRNMIESCLTPPYLTASPEITQFTISPKEKFLILASDGLWDCMTAQQAVDIVAYHRQQILEPYDPKNASNENVSGGASSQGTGITLGQLAARDDNILKGNPVEDMCKANAATRLICYAVGEAVSPTRPPDLGQVRQMLSLPSDVARYHRDDITVVVVFFT